MFEGCLHIDVILHRLVMFEGCLHIDVMLPRIVIFAY